MQSGIATVGQSKSLFLTARVDFPAPFSAPPGVVATPLQGTNYAHLNIADTFAVTVTQVDQKGFNVNIQRVDGKGNSWAQNLRLSWIAFGV